MRAWNLKSLELYCSCRFDKCAILRICTCSGGADASPQGETQDVLSESGPGYLKAAIV